MSLFKTLPLFNSIFSSCRYYYNKTNNNDRDDAHTAQVHSVAVRPQLALPLWKQHCVRHGPEHQRRSALRVRVGVRGQRERRLY